jgi:DNA (cytosine-5)-methyltransferase 1
MDIIDLFCGCGGFSHGFEKVGFNIKYAIDCDNLTQETYEYNHPNTEFILSDIANVDPLDFKGKVSGVIGSPPCVNFSIANSYKNENKGRKNLDHFFEWIEKLEPKFWVMENVSGVMEHLNYSEKYKDTDIPQMVILNSADYGVPQTRERFFAGEFAIPKRSHHKIAYKDIYGNTLRKWISVREALKDVIKVKPNSTDTIPNHKCQRNIRKVKGHQNLVDIDLEKPSFTITSVWDHCYKIRRQNTEKTIQNKNKYDLNDIYRRLTVRECAMLQTFPNDFLFFGSLSNQYTMIGNAVPPLLSYRIALATKTKLQGKKRIVPSFTIHEWYDGNIE